MVETLASYLAMIKQRKKSEYISNTNWRDLGIFNAIVFLGYKNTEGLGKKNKHFREIKPINFNIIRSPT